MKKINILITVILVGLAIAPSVLAVNILNPAPGFFISYNDNSFGGLLLRLIHLLLTIVGLISILFIVYGGFQYITSRGDEEQTVAGKRTLTNAIMGLVIVILSYLIVTVIINTLQSGIK